MTTKKTEDDSGPLISAPVEINRISPQPAPPPKPGYKTTEFWLTLVTSVGVWVTDYVPGIWKVVPVVAYTLARALTKRR